MKAIVFSSPSAPASVVDIPIPEPTISEVRVKLFAAALNRRDYWIKKGIYAGSQYPCFPGSDGAGVVDKVINPKFEHLLGKEVVINPGLFWGQSEHAHEKDFQILGLPRQGTFAQYVCVPAENIHPKPLEYSFEQAAALPLAGLTAYRALFTKGQLKNGEKILITGIGGGVSLFLLKFAAVMGTDIYITSGSEKKLKSALQLGAINGVLYTNEKWDQQLADIVPDGFDIIIDSAGGNGFALLPSLLKTGGRIVNFGGTAGKIDNLIPAKLFWKQASILGTTMGSPRDFISMVSFVEKNRIFPVIDKILPMEDTELAFKLMEKHEQFGKIVIKPPSF